jgi:hypothetical protein
MNLLAEGDFMALASIVLRAVKSKRKFEIRTLFTIKLGTKALKYGQCPSHRLWSELWERRPISAGIVV